MAARRGGWIALAIATLAAGCNALIGLSDFSVGGADADGGPDTGADGPDVTCQGGAVVDVDLTEACYPCTPVKPEEFLNACTGAQCIPFDRSRLTNLLPDGGLPPVPDPPEAGPDGGGA